MLTSFARATGERNVDALIAGPKWASTTIDVAFPESFSDYEPGYPSSAVHAASFAPLNSAQQRVMREWLDAFESASGLRFTEISAATAPIRAAVSDHPSTAYAYYPSDYGPQGGDLWFNSRDFTAPEIGTYAYAVFGHELGHALGLSHGHETNNVGGAAMSADRDSLEFSIMTYRSYVGHDLITRPFYTNGWADYPQSLMMYDIRALQELYGVNYGHRQDDTVYAFASDTGELFVDGEGQGGPIDNRVFRTIWDGGGEDVYDFANYERDLSIDLAPGGWIDLDVGGLAQRAVLSGDMGGPVAYARGHIANALLVDGDPRALIEHATSGSGDDELFGNVAANHLRGGAGADRLMGGAGDDRLDGGSGIDRVDYAAEAGERGVFVQLWKAFATDTHGDRDALAGIEEVVGTSRADRLEGDRAPNRLDGRSGDDLINGRNGDDLLIGGAGNDRLYGGPGDDLVQGQSGDDTIYGGHGDDRLEGHRGADVLIGGAGVNHLFGGAGDDVYVFDTLLAETHSIIREFSGSADRIDFGAIEADRFQVVERRADDLVFELVAATTAATGALSVTVEDQFAVDADRRIEQLAFAGDVYALEPSSDFTSGGLADVLGAQLMADDTII